MKILRPIAAALLAASLLPVPGMAQSAQGGSAGSASPAAAADAALARFFEDYDAAWLARSPMMKSYRGLRDADYGALDDVSEAARQRNVAADRKALADLRTSFASQTLGAESRLSYRLFEAMVERRLARAAFAGHNYVYDQMNGPHTGVPAFMINIHRVESKTDAEAYVARLRASGRQIDQYTERSQTNFAKRLAPPRWVYAQVLGASRNVITGAPFDTGTDAPLYADFKVKVAKLALPQAGKSALIAAAADALSTSVRPAYQRLIAELERQAPSASTDDGVWRLPQGDRYYAALLGDYTTTDLTAGQVHQLGLDQVARIHGEMRGIMTTTGFKGDLPAFFTFMRTDPRFYAPNTEEGRALYLAETEKAKAAVMPLLPQWFSTLPKAPMVVKRVEAFREKSAGKAFYQAPTPDGSRPGTYYANLYDMANMPLTEVEALFYHEGVPGHHFQLALQTEKKGLPPFRVFGGGSVTAYSEGWGLYAERLAKDMGLYTDPYRDFGRLQLELHRAIRLVVDTGLHHKRWTRERAIAYVGENSADAPGGIVKAIERYIVYPGQATAYMVGRLKITDLRERAQIKLGAKFDIRQFHEVVLSSGPVPLDILEERVDAWIASKA